MTRQFFEAVAKWFLSRYGMRLVKRYGNVAVASWILRYALFFNTRGAAVLWLDAPWFFTNGTECDDCVDHPQNTDPVGYFTARGDVLWWQRPGRCVSSLRGYFRTFACSWRRRRTGTSATLPTEELDPYRCSED